MKLYKFTAVFTPDAADKTMYNVLVPAMPEICTCGDSIEEARFMAQDALELAVLSRLEEGEVVSLDKKPVRIPKGSVVEEILVTVAHDVRSVPLTQDAKAVFA